MSQPSPEAAALIEALGLTPHPEGGRYVETYRAPASAPGERSPVTAIYFLLTAGERSHWHAVDAVEIWHWYGGAPLELSIHDEGEAVPTVRTLRLGMDILGGERPQGVVPAHAWQAARALGEWTLVGCTVSPAFDFAGFKLAPPDWSPPTR